VLPENFDWRSFVDIGWTTIYSGGKAVDHKPTLAADLRPREAVFRESMPCRRRSSAALEGASAAKVVAQPKTGVSLMRS